MKLLRIILSLIILLYAVQALAAISFTGFSWQAEGRNLLILALAALIIPTLWSRRTTERLRQAKVVKRVRLLLTIILLLELYELFLSLSYSALGYRHFLALLIIAALLWLWLRSAEQLRLK